MPEELLDLVTTMKCPKCVPTMELVWDTRDLPYTYKGETTLIPAAIHLSGKCRVGKGDRRGVIVF